MSALAAAHSEVQEQAARQRDEAVHMAAITALLDISRMLRAAHLSDPASQHDTTPSDVHGLSAREANVVSRLVFGVNKEHSQLTRQFASATGLLEVLAIRLGVYVSQLTKAVQSDVPSSGSFVHPSHLVVPHQWTTHALSFVSSVCLEDQRNSTTFLNNKGLDIACQILNLTIPPATARRPEKLREWMSLKEAAAHCLTSVCGILLSTAHQHLMDNNVLPALVSGAQNADFPSFRRWCLSALGQLAANPRMHARLTRGGLVEVLAGCLRQHSVVGAKAEYIFALRAVANLVGKEEQHPLLATETEGLRTLCEAVRASLRGEDYAGICFVAWKGVQGLANLALSDGNKDRLLALGIMELAEQAFAHTDVSAEKTWRLREYTAALVWSMVFHPDGAHACQSSTTLMDTLQSLAKRGRRKHSVSKLPSDEWHCQAAMLDADRTTQPCTLKFTLGRVEVRTEDLDAAPLQRDLATCSLRLSVHDDWSGKFCLRISDAGCKPLTLVLNSFDHVSQTLDAQKRAGLAREIDGVGQRTMDNAAGALWVLEHGLHAGAPPVVDDAPPQRLDQGHVMISYCWNDQAVVRDINAKIGAYGINTWIDVEQMQGSTLSAMSAAVEQASVILVCVSSSYQESRACRSEAEYAYVCQKRIVPLKVEEGFVPTGWLGILIGSKLWFELGSQLSTDQTVEALVRELEHGHDASATGSQATAERAQHNWRQALQHQQRQLQHNDQHQSGAGQQQRCGGKHEAWDAHQVCQWLTKQDLGLFCLRFEEQDIDGKALNNLKRRALQPEFITLARQQLGYEHQVTVGDALRLSEALVAL
eukprot:m.29077 g.29077  ORF g.29077 m.29077 type:complete len:818 (-) comp9044_c0_seq1:266-2719(-)